MNRTITVLLATVAALVGLGLAMLASLTLANLNSQRFAAGAGVWHPWMMKQGAACVVGFVALCVMATRDYRSLERWVWPVYGITLISLLLVLTPFGTSVKGAQRWILGVQPSEFAKVALILSLAWYSARFSYRMQTFTTGVLGTGAIALPLLALIVVEPDKGTTLLLAFVTVSLMLVSGVRWFHVLIPVVLGGVAFGFLIAGSGYARDRVRAYWNPESNPALTYQVDRSLDAMGAGGIRGTGFGAGTQKWNIPEVSTDFVFPAVGEELGLPGTLSVVAAFLILLVSGAVVAHRAPDAFGMVLASGVTFVIAAQALVNLGVVTDLLPNKGMALPFLSRGGTGTVVMLTLVGLLISVARRSGFDPGSEGRRLDNPFGDADTDFPQ
ncbi:MAG: cell division protein FtsW [Verrucomicrobiales bacterium]|nr:cell division protein FtsW [Verrucomicrobiales bacterium]